MLGAVGAGDLTAGRNGGGAFLGSALGLYTSVDDCGGGACIQRPSTRIGGGCLLGAVGGGDLTAGRNGGGAFLGSALGLYTSVDDCGMFIANK